MDLFGDVLKKCRSKRRLSVREAARQLKVSPTTITNLEGGKTPDPKASMIWKMSEFYDLDAGFMLRLACSDKAVDRVESI